MVAINHVNQGREPGKFEPLPAGEYLVHLVKAVEREAKRNPGSFYIEAEFGVLDGQYKDRRFWFKYFHKSPKAAESYGRQMDAFCTACGKLRRVGDTDELLGIAFWATLDVKNDPQYGPKNVISAYRGAATGQAISPPSHTPQGLDGDAPF